MKNLEVQIMGQNYVLGCPEESEARLRQAVAKVDAAMCKVRDAGRIKARDRIAVLVALNFAFDLLKSVSALAEPEQATDASMATAGDISASQPQLDALLQRLDTALGGADGRRH